MRAAALVRSIWIAGMLGAMMAGADAQTPSQNATSPTPPLSIPQANYYRAHPQEFQQLLAQLAQDAGQGAAAREKLAPAQPPLPGQWSNLTNSPGVSVLQNPLLMTDGTVIAQHKCSSDWWRLTPDNTGSYINGTWSQIASLPSGYFPLFYGSGVLPDGRVIIEGGEYNNTNGSCGNGAWTSKGAIYDPVANIWTAITPPSGWTEIGDAAGIVLDNGTFMQSDCCDYPPPLAALLNAGTLTWTATGSGKADRYDEEGFAKMPGGSVLDVNAHTSGSCTKTSEVYNASTGTWSATGNTVDQQADCANPAGDPSYELGPLVWLRSGVALIFPGLLCGDKANTNCTNQAPGYVVTGTVDSYNQGTGVWSSLVTIPTLTYPYSLADAPAAVLPSGNVLFAASPDYRAFIGPKHYFELNPNGTITQVADTADSSGDGAYTDNFLLLPTGQVLVVSQLRQHPDLHVELE